jgi:hypothetical protein
MMEKNITIFCNNAEDFRILLITRSDGLYQYEVQTFFGSAEEDEGIEFGWQPNGPRSGVFESAAEAEREALVAWKKNTGD